MHIPPERIITTLQYPCAPPLPIFTDGLYPYRVSVGACVTLAGRIADNSVTAIVRLVATPIAVASGAARWGWHGLHYKSIAVVPFILVGVVLGAALGAATVLGSLLDLLWSSADLMRLVFLLSRRLVLGSLGQVLGTVSPTLRRVPQAFNEAT